MARKRRKPKRTQKSNDRLGRLLQAYRPNAGIILGGVLLTVLAGTGVLIYWLAVQPELYWLLLVSLGLFLLAPVLLVTNTFNFGRSLQVRIHGVRFVEAGIETELTWDEVANIEVSRTDSMNMGIVTVRTKQSELHNPGLPLSSPEWEITIRGHDGRTIHLSPMFLKHVSNVPGLVILMRQSAGLK